jgi:hypothetical protein
LPEISRTLADRRDRRDAPADHGLDLDRHRVAAVRIRADRHRFRLERAQAAAFARAHIGIERRLVLARVMQGHALALGAERRTGGFQVDVVELALMGADRVVETRDLLFEQHVAAALERSEALVVRLLELRDGAHHLAMRDERIARHAGLGFELRFDVHMVLLHEVDKRV